MEVYSEIKSPHIITARIINARQIKIHYLQNPLYNKIAKVSWGDKTLQNKIPLHLLVYYVKFHANFQKPKKVANQVPFQKLDQRYFEVIGVVS